MRTIFTTEDIRQIITTIFNGNLGAVNKNPTIPYVNENSENIILKDESGEKKIDLAKYLNIDFYSWKNRVVSQDETEQPLSNFETWLDSLNYSMEKGYALIETTGSEVVPSQDIDSATISARITFLIQTNKVANLDYYVAKIRNKFLGLPQDIQNSFGEKIKAYISFNSLDYDTEPTTIQYGECIIVSVKVKITYLTEALNYNDTPMYLSFDGTNYYQIPYTKTTWQNIFTGQAFPTQTLPNRTGVVNSSMTQVKTFTFYDFNKTLTLELNKKFWQLGAWKIKTSTDLSPVLVGSQPVNIPIYIKVISDGVEYYFKDNIKTMQKDITNSDFIISSLTLQGDAKR